ncbi:MAG: Yip1 family protein [Clostridia bacterium]
MSDGVFDWLYGVMAGPAEALRAVAAKKPVGWALAVIVGTATLLSTAGLSQTNLGVLPGVTFRDLARTALTGAVILSVAGCFIVVGLLHLAALLFGGKGSFSGLLSAVGFAQFPALLSLPLMALARVGGPVVAGLSVVASAGIAVWVAALCVVSLREAHGLSTGAAIGTCIFGAMIPAVVVAGLVFLAVALAGVIGAGWLAGF